MKIDKTERRMIIDKIFNYKRVLEKLQEELTKYTTNNNYIIYSTVYFQIRTTAKHFE